MERIIDDIKQPSWWFTVVIIGLAINILAAYLKPAIDKIFGKISARRREKNLENRKRKEELISLLLQNPLKILEYKLDLVYFSILLVFRLVLALAFLSLMLYIVAEPYPYSQFEIILSVIFFLALVYQFRETYLTLLDIFDRQSILDEVRKRDKIEIMRMEK
jgi:hypothetical protein